MPEDTIQDRIIKDLKALEETGRITSEKIYEIFRDTIYHAATEGAGGSGAIKSIAKEAVIAAVKLFQDDKEKEKENITSAVRGTMAGIKLCKEKRIDALKKEINHLEAKIKFEEKEVSYFLEQGVEGVSEAESAFSEEMTTLIESVLTDIRFKTEELSGVNGLDIKDAIKQAIESGDNIKEAVIQITKAATKKALEKSRLKAGRVKEVTEKILSDAVDAAEETEKNIKDVTSGAFKGIYEGIVSMADSITDSTREFVREDLSDTREDFKTIKDLFFETVLKVGKRSGRTAKKILNDLAAQSKATGSTFKEETGGAADKFTEKLKTLGKEVVKTFGETGEKATRVMTDEVKELGKKSMDVAKGGMTGMWKGAKQALEKDKNE